MSKWALAFSLTSLVTSLAAWWNTRRTRRSVEALRSALGE